MRRRAIPLFFAALLVLPAARAAEPVSTGFFGHVAIGGQDTVSYHLPQVRQNHAVQEGDKRFEVSHLGATWRFASRESADRFAANPQHYLPRYNGHCANALALGEGLIATNGTIWDFFGDRLHLFYGEAGRQRWLKGDWKAYQAQADAAWAAILKK